MLAQKVEDTQQQDKQDDDANAQQLLASFSRFSEEEIEQLLLQFIDNERLSLDEQ